MSADEGFLSRWSRRKRAAASGEPTTEPAGRTRDAAVAPSEAPAAPVPGDVTAARPGAADAPQPPATDAPLPSVDGLNIDSDFSPFMAREVDPGLKREALKALFRDERFNVMDGLDVYIDDYTKPAPIPPEWYAKMAQMAYLGDLAGREEAKKEGREAEGAVGPAHDCAAPAIDVGGDGGTVAPAPGPSRDDESETASGTVPSEPRPQ